MSPRVKRIIFFILTITEIILVFTIWHEILIKRTRLSEFILSEKYYFRPSGSILHYYYEPKPNEMYTATLAYKNTNGPQVVTRHVNGAGFDQLTNYPIDKSSGVFRIITLGDSFTEGTNVNTQQSYPSQLAELLNTRLNCKNILSFQVLNLGVDGYDIQYAVERYRLDGQKYDPDLVLWFIIDDDFNRLGEVTRPLIMQFKAQLTQSELNEYHKEGIYYPELLLAENAAREKIGGGEKLYALQKQYLNLLTKYYKKRLVVFTFPFTDQDKLTVMSRFASARHDTFFYNNLPDIYNTAADYLPDKHPSPQGYKAIVDNMYEYLTTNKIIPCKR